MSLIPPTLPASYPDWQLAVDNHDLAAKTVHTAELASASKMNFLQFLLLRVVWKTHETKSPTRLPAKVKEWIPRAKELLNGLSSWKTYLSSFRRTDNPEGTFSIARHYQIQAARTKGAIRPESFDTPIAKRTRSHDPDLASKMKDLQLKTPTKKPEEPPQTPTLDSFDDQSVLPEMTPSPPITPAARVPKEFQGDLLVPTKDEQIVNTALAVFLDALTIHFGIINSCSWTMHRKAFVAVFEEAQFEARTDGYLDDGNENPFVLIEVKPIPRAEKASLIQVQEGAQMVSWIKNDASAKLDKPRIHLSQDRDEIFITVAEYDSDYIAYLTKKSADQSPPSLLTMHQLGPWNVRSQSDMSQLGPILLAITLYADQEVRKARRS